MRELQPQLTAIKEKYGDDPQKQQEAMMAGCTREAGVNPLGGCLPMLLQYPILIAMWRFFQSTLVLRGESFLWAKPTCRRRTPSSEPALHDPVRGRLPGGLHHPDGGLDGDLDAACRWRSSSAHAPGRPAEGA